MPLLTFFRFSYWLMPSIFIFFPSISQLFFSLNNFIWQLLCLSPGGLHLGSENYAWRLRFEKTQAYSRCIFIHCFISLLAHGSGLLSLRRHSCCLLKPWRPEAGTKSKIMHRLSSPAQKLNHEPKCEMIHWLLYHCSVLGSSSPIVLVHVNDCDSGFVHSLLISIWFWSVMIWCEISYFWIPIKFIFWLCVLLRIIFCNSFDWFELYGVWPVCVREGLVPMASVNRWNLVFNYVG